MPITGWCAGTGAVDETTVDETTIEPARRLQLIVRQLTVTVKVVVADVFAESLPVPVTVNV
jgi:hypothetical protein